MSNRGKTIFIKSQVALLDDWQPYIKIHKIQLEPVDKWNVKTPLEWGPRDY